MGFGLERRRNLTAPDPAANALILTPVRLDEANTANEERTVTVAEMQNGAKIETSNLGRLYGREFHNRGSRDYL